MNAIVRMVSVLLIVGIGFGLYGKETRIVDLKEPEKPYYFTISEGLLAMQDKSSVFLYDLKDFKLITTIGKEGEGPGEFMFTPYPQFIDQGIMISSSKKLSFYDLSGNLLNEIKTQNSRGIVRKIGNHYVSDAIEIYSEDFIISYNLYNKNFQVEKELHRGDWAIHKDGKREFLEIYFFDVHKDRIIFAHRSGFTLEILDKLGNNLHTIKLDPPKIPFTKTDKEQYFADFFKGRNLGEDANTFKKRFKPTRYFPAIRTCIAADGKIYVITYKRSEQGSECLVFDLQGKQVKKTFITLSDQFGFMPPATIAQGKLYRLVEDLDKEVWQLHITPID